MDCVYYLQGTLLRRSRIALHKRSPLKAHVKSWVYPGPSGRNRAMTLQQLLFLVGKREPGLQPHVHFHSRSQNIGPAQLVLQGKCLIHEWLIRKFIGFCFCPPDNFEGRYQESINAMWIFLMTWLIYYVKSLDLIVLLLITFCHQQLSSLMWQSGILGSSWFLQPLPFLKLASPFSFQTHRRWIT